jgi:hypothetical protein
MAMFQARRFIFLVAVAVVLIAPARLGQSPVALAQDAPVDQSRGCLSPSPSGRPV